VLLEHGAEVNRKDKCGLTALDSFRSQATFDQIPRSPRLLKQHGAKSGSPIFAFITPFYPNLKMTLHMS